MFRLNILDQKIMLFNSWLMENNCEMSDSTRKNLRILYIFVVKSCDILFKSVVLLIEKHLPTRHNL